MAEVGRGWMFGWVESAEISEEGWFEWTPVLNLAPFVLRYDDVAEMLFGHRRVDSFFGGRGLPRDRSDEVGWSFAKVSDTAEGATHATRDEISQWLTVDGLYLVKHAGSYRDGERRRKSRWAVVLKLVAELQRLKILPGDPRYIRLVVWQRLLE